MRQATKFSPANVQKIKDSVAQKLSRIEISKLLDVTVGSLQVTCSRLGISLRRRDVLNGNASHSLVMNGNAGRHDIPNHPPMVGHKRADGRFQVTLESNGARRTTDLPLTNSDIAELGLEAGARNIRMGQLLTDIMIKAIRKNMIEEILREASQEPAPKGEGT